MNNIINSLLDTDWYKPTMGQVVYHRFPHVVAAYDFINRGKTEFPSRFAEELRKQVDQMAKLKLTEPEERWLRQERLGSFDQVDNVLSSDYVDYLAKYRFKPEQVSIIQTAGQLDIKVTGPWYETIFWEVPLMATISELYYRMLGKFPDSNYSYRIRDKARRFAEAKLKWIDFGTRRRFSAETQATVVTMMRKYHPYFRGTSNPYFAYEYGTCPVGTYAHESVMAMQAVRGVVGCNRAWMDHWLDEYKGKLGIALTDTVTTGVFLRDFNYYYANAFMGVRQDSGDPIQFGERMIAHYKNLDIDPLTKTIVFSDKLNTDSAIAIHNYFMGKINTLFGIGTHLTNDCGHLPLNMVIKLISVNFGNGWFDVVKLSDEQGKYTGTPEAIAKAKEVLDIKG